MTKRILVVTPWKRRWEMGGTAGLADDYYFIEGFTRNGFEVHYLSPRYRGADVSLDGYVVHTFPNFFDATDRWPVIIKRPLWPLLFALCAVVRGLGIIHRFPPSVILGQTHLSAAAVWILARCARVPSLVKLFGVVELDRTDWPRWKYLRKNLEQILAFKTAQDAWVVLDDGTGGAAAARRHGVAPGRIHELPNGVNLEWGERSPEADARARYHIPAGTAVVLLLSRLTEWKRPDLIIRAAPQILRESRRPVLFLVAGDGHLRDSCAALAARLGVAPSVRFLGPVAHDDVPALMSATTVFVSTNERSNRGIPVCEAMVCGVPVVALDVGDTKEVVHEGDTGRLIADGDLGGFATAVAELINDDGKRATMSRRARAFARETFTGWRERIAMELAIVAALMERAGRRGAD
ncbi:MAG TPA: glycosyltransferase family 4 protein [Candidatus Krumholzibacteria bacterium]|nr:glycosyltransferase family 4 protein [Candidatus Krumholzibacteria bacterium]